MKAASVTASYKRWAPVYDSVFGKVFQEGRIPAMPRNAAVMCWKSASAPALPCRFTAPA